MLTAKHQPGRLRQAATRLLQSIQFEHNDPYPFQAHDDDQLN